MITELLRPEKIVTGLSGGLAQALEQLFTRSSFPDRVNEYRTALIGGNSKLYTYVDDEIAVPHVRIEGLPGTDMILGLARKGVRFNGHSIKIFFFLATPAEQTEEHSRHTVRTAALLSVFLYPAFEDYFFAPMPWHVYLFAFHGTALLLIFEEVKNYYRRRGYPLEFLG